MGKRGLKHSSLLVLVLDVPPFPLSLLGSSFLGRWGWRGVRMLLAECWFGFGLKVWLGEDWGISEVEEKRQVLLSNTRRCAEEEQTLRRRSVHFRSLLQVYGEQRGREEEKGLGLFVNIRLVWQIYNNKKLFDRRFWGSTL